MFLYVLPRHLLHRLTNSSLDPNSELNIEVAGTRPTGFKVKVKQQIHIPIFMKKEEQCHKLFLFQ